MGKYRIAFVVSVVTLLLALPLTASAHGGTELIVTGTPRADGGIELSGEGFDPDATVRVVLQRANIEPIDLGSVPTDEEGNWSATLHVPADAAPGLYQVEAIGADESASVEVTLLEAALGGGTSGETSTPPSIANDRPAAEAIGLLIAAAVLAVGGAALLWPDRRSLLRGG